MLNQDQQKNLVGTKSATLVKTGMKIGLGTGSTVFYLIQELGKRVREQGLQIQAVCTSIQTENLAKKNQIQVKTLAQVSQLDLTIDGADEFDVHLNLIKGGGGALLREKIVAYHSKKFVIISDESKKVDTLGAFKLPIEVVQFGADTTLQQIQKICPKSTFRISPATKTKFVTDNQNFIIDCDFLKIENTYQLQSQLKSIPGVVETGLFLNMADLALVGTGDSQVLQISK